MTNDFFAGLSEALLREYPDKGVRPEQITGAVKTAPVFVQNPHTSKLT